MGLHHTQDASEASHYSSLRQQCDELDILTDDLYLLDVQSVADDHRFFPFGDVMKELVLCFSRDSLDCVYDVHGSGSGSGGDYVSGGTGRGGGSSSGARDTDKSKSSISSSKSSLGSISSGGHDVSNGHGVSNGNGNSNGNGSDGSGSGSGSKGDSAVGMRTVKPSSSSPSSPSPSGCAVQPFLGLANYTAPLCYLYTDKATLYSMSSQLWAKLWCKLNVITGDRGALLCVCKTFENLLAALDPKLFLHLLSLNIQPLRVAFSWIQLSFVSFFEIDQLLILWDRVIGFTDLALFSLLAVAIFIYRSETLLNCSKSEKALLILNEGSGLKVIPLLQMMLFSGK
jgi:Rab-GTPase-TBC domain